MIWIHGTKSDGSDRLNPMTDALRSFLLKLKSESNPSADDRIAKIDSVKRALTTACVKCRFPKFSHHDFRHFFATTCIESGVDIPTVSRWLGHSDGGALAMRVYGHLQIEHSLSMSKRVSFDQSPDAVPSAPPAVTKATSKPSGVKEERHAIAKAKAKYKYPWWASENLLEVCLGQLDEQTEIVPTAKLLQDAKQVMGREVFGSELADRESLLDELKARTSEKEINDALLRIQSRKAENRESEATAVA